LGEWVAQAAQSSGLATLAWGGGCFLNSLLSVRLRQNLEQRGITVLAPVCLSPGDAGVALGQAWVAMDSLE
jgi:hydrogenase maturation protein HypF